MDIKDKRFRIIKPFGIYAGCNSIDNVDYGKLFPNGIEIGKIGDIVGFREIKDWIKQGLHPLYFIEEVIIFPAFPTIDKNLEEMANEFRNEQKTKIHWKKLKVSVHRENRKLKNENDKLKSIIKLITSNKECRRNYEGQECEITLSGMGIPQIFIENSYFYLTQEQHDIIKEIMDNYEEKTPDIDLSKIKF